MSGLGFQARKKKLAETMRGIVQPQAEDVVEDRERRERIKAELRRLIDVVDDGRFECMIVSELIDNNGTPKIMTGMLGELGQIKAAAAHIIEHYSAKKMKGGKKPFMVAGG